MREWFRDNRVYSSYGIKSRGGCAFKDGIDVSYGYKMVCTYIRISNTKVCLSAVTTKCVNYTLIAVNSVSLGSLN